MADLDTELPGAPSQIRSAAGWLRDSLAPAFAAAADSYAEARRRATSDWDDQAGRAFVTRATTGVQVIDGLSVTASQRATELDAYATALEQAQLELAEVVSTAEAAGLTVLGRHVVMDPGPGPDRPADPPAEMTPRQSDIHGIIVKLYNEHQELREAFNEVVEAYHGIVATFHEACDTLAAHTKEGLAFQVTQVIGATTLRTADRALGRRVHRLADLLADQARHKVAGRSVLVRDAEATRNKLIDRIERSERRLPKLVTVDKLTKPLGPLGTGLGIHADMQAGESAAQAVTSNVAGTAVTTAAIGLTGIGASALAGAAGGSVVPVLGTVVGAVAGVGLGLATSGLIDKHWPVIADTMSTGWATLQDHPELAVVSNPGNPVAGALAVGVKLAGNLK